MSLVGRALAAPRWLRDLVRALRDPDLVSPAQRKLVDDFAWCSELEPSVRDFYTRAFGAATGLGHTWAFEAASPPADLAALIALAPQSGRIVELGTGPAWTTIALALARPGCRVTSFDPVEHEHRERYLGLVEPSVRNRLEFVQAPGASPDAAAPGPVDMLFVDSTHERAATVEEFNAWRGRLVPGAVVAFHDYDHPEFPGVAEAVGELGLEGEVVGGMFVWRAP